MKKLFAASMPALPLLASTNPVFAQKSALDGFVFDGVASDAELTVAKITRSHWLDTHSIQAKDYWPAWDCKNAPCDSKVRARIRQRAKLISRADKDPKPVNATPAAKK